MVKITTLTVLTTVPTHVMSTPNALDSTSSRANALTGGLEVFQQGHKPGIPVTSRKEEEEEAHQEEVCQQALVATTLTGMMCPLANAQAVGLKYGVTDISLITAKITISPISVTVLTLAICTVSVLGSTPNRASALIGDRAPCQPGPRLATAATPSRAAPSLRRKRRLRPKRRLRRKMRKAKSGASV